MFEKFSKFKCYLLLCKIVEYKKKKKIIAIVQFIVAYWKITMNLHKNFEYLWIDDLLPNITKLELQDCKTL